MTALTMFAQSEPMNKLWELDVLRIQDPQSKKSKEERVSDQCEHTFLTLYE
jgi:hypothetical protein